MTHGFYRIEFCCPASWEEPKYDAGKCRYREREQINTRIKNERHIHQRAKESGRAKRCQNSQDAAQASKHQSFNQKLHKHFSAKRPDCQANADFTGACFAARTV